MKPVIFSWTFVALFAFLISSAAGLSYWWAVSVVVVAMILNGILAKIEFRMAGGYFNPMKKEHVLYASATAMGILIWAVIGLVFFTLFSLPALLTAKAGEPLKRRR